MCTCTMCTLQLCVHALQHWQQVIGHVHFTWATGGTYPWRGAAWSKFEVACRPLPSTHVTHGFSWVVYRHHRHVGCRPDTRFENTPFEMMIKSINWGILSTSLVVCENNLVLTRSDIIGFVRFVLVQPTDKACSFNQMFGTKCRQ